MEGSRGSERKVEANEMDVIWLTIGMGLFGLTWVLLRGLERLAGED